MEHHLLPGSSVGVDAHDGISLPLGNVCSPSASPWASVCAMPADSPLRMSNLLRMLTGAETASVLPKISPTPPFLSVFLTSLSLFLFHLASSPVPTHTLCLSQQPLLVPESRIWVQPCRLGLGPGSIVCPQKRTRLWTCLCLIGIARPSTHTPSGSLGAPSLSPPPPVRHHPPCRLRPPSSSARPRKTVLSVCCAVLCSAVLLARPGTPTLPYPPLPYLPYLTLPSHSTPLPRPPKRSRT